MSEKYTYGYSDFLYNKANLGSLTDEIITSSITVALDYINADTSGVDIWFKAALPSADVTTLSGIVVAHEGEPLPDVEPPRMSDGRPIVRADTRPLETETFFTMAGDTASGIGDGTVMMWDMDEDDDWTDLGNGYMRKKFELSFNNVLYLKDGTIYFFNAPWGSWIDFYITVPAGSYYPNEYGTIPASALGLSGNDMYAYASNDVLYRCYVNKHHMFGDCPMGDELNTEGASVDGLPVGWKLTGHIHAPATSSGTGFKGYASLESYRARTVVLPGDPLGPPTT
jgi:hypothetical protein